MLRFSGAGVSDVGLVRPHNEDSGFVGPYVAIVADGVGGAAAGEVASATAAYAVSATALARFGDRPEEVIRAGVEAARESLRAGVHADSSRHGMATTMTVVMTYDDRVVLGHAGDSRAYLLRGDTLTQVSRDHTYVQSQIDEQRLTAEQALQHPWRNVVLCVLDGSPAAEQTDIDVVELAVAPGDRLLLCSDGLSDLVGAERIAEVLGLDDAGAAAAVLTQSALQAGGRDNITCVVLDLVDGPVVVGDGRLLGALWDFTNIVDPAAVRLAQADTA